MSDIDMPRMFASLIAAGVSANKFTPRGNAKDTADYTAKVAIEITKQIMAEFGEPPPRGGT